MRPYFDKERGHPLGCVVVPRDAVNHPDGVDEARDAFQHANLDPHIKQNYINWPV